MSKKRSNRIPTDEEIKNFDGGVLPKFWKTLPENWECPGCGRLKKYIMRYLDEEKRWIMRCADHHDHLGWRWDGYITVCDACNNVDTICKQFFKNNNMAFNPEFSFSPEEIKKFIRATPHHSKHKIDFNRAYQIYLNIFKD